MVAYRLVLNCTETAHSIGLFDRSAFKASRPVLARSTQSGGNSGGKTPSPPAPPAGRPESQRNSIQRIAPASANPMIATKSSNTMPCRSIPNPDCLRSISLPACPRCSVAR
jgi:hypothetical protein